MSGQKRKFFCGGICLLLAGALLCTCGCAAGGADTYTYSGPVAKAEGKSFYILGDDGNYEAVFLDGVNIGAAESGYFPGEFGVSKEDYLRWFQLISDMNVQTIRVYVNQMPDFYEALAEFNKKADKPLYLLHGVYVNEDYIDRYMDAYGGDGIIYDSFAADIKNAVDMIHGSAEIEKTAGNAGGVYSADVSRWVIGWILGIEWSADFVIGTNEANADKLSFAGDYVYTENASPFEVFLAEQAETAIAYEMERYGEQRPVALCNWCTTDPLAHPNEPNAAVEDAVSVDVEHIRAAEAFEAGFFASYHVYPYYPEFFSYDTKYLAGDDPYLAYLQELTAYHTMPVLVAEYGIPASRGIAHINTVTGMSQGHVSEEQQGEWLITLNEDIRSAGCMGGLIFNWQDEWFKRTWNSMDYEDPERRPYWYNVQSPEECFGLLAFDSGEAQCTVTVDGSDAEWSEADILCENDGVRLSVRSDASYLYLLLSSSQFDFENDTLYLPIDVLTGQGNTTYNGKGKFASGAEFLLRLRGRYDSALLTDAYYDVFQYDYCVRNEFFAAVDGQFVKDSGCFDSIYLAMNRQMNIPVTGETTEFQRFDTGALHCGCADPQNDAYDSLTDFALGDSCAEIRIPWMLIGFTDPSQKKVIGDFNELGAIESVTTDGVRIGVCLAESTAEAPMTLYSWENWDMPVTHERLKQSYWLLRDYFAANR